MSTFKLGREIPMEKARGTRNIFSFSRLLRSFNMSKEPKRVYLSIYISFQQMKRCNVQLAYVIMIKYKIYRKENLSHLCKYHWVYVIDVKIDSDRWLRYGNHNVHSSTSRYCYYSIAKTPKSGFTILCWRFALQRSGWNAIHRFFSGEMGRNRFWAVLENTN